MTKKGYVYEWINTLNGKWYIGSHDGSNPNYTASGILINRAFDKYGMDAFVCHKFYCDNFREEEEKALQRRGAASDPMSYNLKDMAIGGFDPAYRGPGMLGLTHSEDAKAKISEAMKTKKNRAKTVVIDNVTYSSLKEAASALGVSDTTIANRIKQGLYGT